MINFQKNSELLIKTVIRCISIQYEKPKKIDISLRLSTGLFMGCYYKLCKKEHRLYSSPYFDPSPIPNFDLLHPQGSGNRPNEAARAQWRRRRRREYHAASPATLPPSNVNLASIQPSLGCSQYSEPPGGGGTLKRLLLSRIYLTICNEIINIYFILLSYSNRVISWVWIITRNKISRKWEGLHCCNYCYISKKNALL